MAAFHDCKTIAPQAAFQKKRRGSREEDPRLWRKLFVADGRIMRRSVQLDKVPHTRPERTARWR
jgi:hypothetical protein